MEKNNLDQLFQEKLGNARISPSDGAIQVFNDRMNLRKRAILFRRIGVAASIVIVIGIGIVGFNQITERNSRIALEMALSPGDEMVNVLEDKVIKEIPLPQVVKDNNYSNNDKVEANREDIIISDQVVESGQTIPGKSLAMLVEPSGIEVKNETDVITETEISYEPDSQTGGRFIEYSIVEDNNISENQFAVSEPVKITIEYKSSGNKTKKESKIKQLYSRMDNMKSADEVFGDLRTLKDKVFALNFKKENKVENQKKPE